MSIAEILSIIREEFDLSGCIACCPEKLWLLELPIPPLGMTDVLGIKWCVDGYPGVVHGAGRYTLEAGAWFTVQVALTGTDECVVLLGAAALEQREVA